jgi:hypothetical protein
MQKLMQGFFFEGMKKELLTLPEDSSVHANMVDV